MTASKNCRVGPGPDAVIASNKFGTCWTIVKPTANVLRSSSEGRADHWLTFPCGTCEGRQQYPATGCGAEQKAIMWPVGLLANAIPGAAFASPRQGAHFSPPLQFLHQEPGRCRTETAPANQSSAPNGRSASIRPAGRLPLPEHQRESERKQSTAEQRRHGYVVPEKTCFDGFLRALAP